MALPTEDRTPTPIANDFSTALAALNAKAVAAKPKPKPTANDWTTELDRLRAQSAAATNRPVAKPAQRPAQEEPQRETPRPKPAKPFSFFDEGRDAWGIMRAGQVAERSTSDVLREREVANRVGEESYVRSQMLPNVGKDTVDPWGVTAVIAGVNVDNTYSYKYPFDSQTMSPMDKPAGLTTSDGRPRFTEENPYPEIGYRNASVGEDGSLVFGEDNAIVALQKSWADRQNRFSTWWNRNPYSAVMQPNPAEMAVLSFLPPSFANFAVASAFEFGGATQGAGNSPAQFGVNVLQAFTPHGMSQALINSSIYFASNPEARDQMSALVAEQVKSAEAVGSGIAGSYTTALGSDAAKEEVISRLLLEPYNVDQYERLLAQGQDIETARRIMRGLVELEADGYLQRTAITTAVADNGMNVVGTTFMAFGTAWNSYWGAFEGGQSIVDAGVAVVSFLNYLGALMDAEWRNELLGTGYTPMQISSMTVDAVGAAVSPMFEERTTGSALQVANNWTDFTSALMSTGSRMNAAWNGTAAEIQKYSADNVNAQYQLAIDDYEEQYGKLDTELERVQSRLTEIGGVPASPELAAEQAQLGVEFAKLTTLSEIKRGQIVALEDVMYSGVAETVDDLELRWQTSLDRITAVDTTEKAITEAYEAYAEAFQQVAFTPQQKRERDEKFLAASEKYAEAIATLEESPLRQFDRAYINDRFVFDMLAPTFLFDGSARLLKLFGVFKSAAKVRLEDAARVSGVETTISRAATAQQIADVSGALHNAYSKSQDLVQQSRVAVSGYATEVSRLTGIDAGRFVNKSVSEIDAIVKAEGSFPMLGRPLSDARRIATRAEKKANDAVQVHAERYAAYEDMVQRQVDSMYEEMTVRMGVAADIAESAQTMRPGRQNAASTFYRSSKSAASAISNDTHRAFTDVFMHVKTKEDAIQILRAMRNPDEFLKGVQGQWSSPVLFKATNNGVDKFVFNPEPWMGKNARRGLSTISRRMDDFIEYLEADILNGVGELNTNLLMQEFDHFVEWSFAQDTWAKGAKAKLPFGTASAKSGKSKSGHPRLQYLDRNGTVIREVMAPDITTAGKLADGINKSARGDYFRLDPIAAFGNAKRRFLAVPFIGWNPANLIQQFMHPVVNSLFRVDGVNSTGIGRGGLRTLGQIEDHVEKLWGTENTTRRAGSSDFAQNAGIGAVTERTFLEKLAKPLGPVYVWVEEGAGKQFYYDAAMKFIQKYGRQVADKVLQPNLIAEGVDPIIAKKASNIFYDVAYREGFEAAAKAALDVIDGNVARYTMSDFDPHWASWMHPEVARHIEDVLNSSVSISDIDSRITDVIKAFDESMQEFDVTTTPSAGGARHAFTQADLLQDASELTQDATNAKNNAPRTLKPQIDAELQQTLAALKQNQQLLQGLVAQVSKNENLPNVGNAFYTVWKAMRDGRTNIAMKSNELAEAIHLAGGKQKWATDYWPQVNKMWADYYTEMQGVIARTKEAIDSGELAGLTRPEDMIVEHSRHTDEFLKNQLNISPGSGAYDNSLKIVMDAARAIERNQHSNFASVSQHSGAPWSRVFDEAVSAERDIAMRKVQIRGELNRLAEQVRIEYDLTKNPNVWNEYYTQRNALWRNLFSDYVPARWTEATRNLLGGRSDTILNEIISRFGNVTPERAADIANTIRTTLKADTLPPTRVVSPSANMTTDARKAVNKTALFDEIFPILDGAEGDEFVVRTASNRPVSITTADIDPTNKKITVKGSSRDLSSIRMIEDADGNVLWDADASPAWDVAQIKFKAGDDVIWRVNDTDTPIKVTGYLGEQNGVRYYSIEGSNTGVPESQIIRPKPAAQVPNVGTGGIQSSAPSVSPALAGIANNAFGDGKTVGWFDTLAATNPRVARNLTLSALNELKVLHPEIDDVATFRSIMETVSEYQDMFPDMADDWVVSPAAFDVSASSAKPWVEIFDGAVRADFERLLDNAFTEMYGGTVSDTLSNLANTPGLSVLEPQVNRGNIAGKMAKAFGVPDEMADSFAQIVDAYARHVAEMWLDQEGLEGTRFATRDEYLDYMTDMWYEDSLIDIVHSGKGGGVGFGFSDTIAQVERAGFYGTDTKSLIRTLDGALQISDKTQRLRVLGHEWWHVFHYDLMKQSTRANNRASELLISLWEHLNDDVYRPGQKLSWTVDNMEQSAVMFERFLETGAAKVPALQPLFEKFAQWLKGTITLYENFRKWMDETPLVPGSTRSKAYIRNVGYQIFSELFGGEQARVPTLAERGVNAAGESVDVPNVGKAPKTVPDIAYMNMIRKTANDVFPELAEALKGIKNLKDVPPQLMPLVQQMADIYAMRKKLAVATGAKDVAKMTDLEKAIDSVAKVHSQYSPEFRASIKDGNFWSNAQPNKKSPTPNTSAMYSIEQLQNMRTRVVDDLRNRSHAAQRAGTPRPQLPTSDVPAMPPDVRLKSGTYLYNTFRSEWDKVMHGANVAGDTMRSFTMTDFWNRTRADDLLQLISPFPFWSTRDIKNGFERAWRNPSFIWHLDRIDQSLERAYNAYAQQQEDNENSLVPQRYSNKMGVFGGGWVPEWARNFIPAGANGEQVPIAVFWPVGLSRFFPTNTIRMRDAMQSGRRVDTGNALMDFANVGIMSGVSLDPWINEYLSMQSGNQSQWRWSDWTVQTRAAAWSALGMMHPKDWNSMPTATRPDWYEYTVARELENMTQRGIITDRMTLGLAMDYLYSMYNKGEEFDSPEWQNATPVQQEAVWSALIAARDAAIGKVQVQSGTGWLTGFPVYLYDTAEGRTNWEQSVRRGLYYDPARNPLGTNEAANLYTTQNLSLQAADMQGKIQPKIETSGGWIPDNQVTPKTPRPIAMAATSQRREDMLAMDVQIMDLTSKAVSGVLAKNPLATSSEMNTAKVESLLPMAREILGDEAVDKWLAEQQKGLKKNQKVTHFGGLITLMREEVAKETPSAYTETSNADQAPPGTPRRYMEDNLAHGSPFSTIPEKADTYNEALGRFPSPVNPDMLRNNHTVAAVELVVDLYKYPEYGSTKTGREYAQKAQAADKQREEHLAKLLRITVEEARELLDQYENRYMGEDEITRREQMDAQGYGGSGSRGYYPRRSYSRGRSGYSRGGYSRGTWGGGDGWGGGSESGETDLLPSIESYIGRRRNLASNLWSRPRSKYAVR